MNDSAERQAIYTATTKKIRDSEIAALGSIEVRKRTRTDVEIVLNRAGLLKCLRAAGHTVPLNAKAEHISVSGDLTDLHAIKVSYLEEKVSPAA